MSKKRSRKTEKALEKERTGKKVQKKNQKSSETKEEKITIEPYQIYCLKSNVNINDIYDKELGLKV